ncbi:hypothetical protein ABI59_11905 [Acidobacteria bacterium Mor1]|nr:hypothetical protein ABI59_11905 [Acidobacteria bacterium Mor1]
MSTDPKHPIQVVVRRTGLTADVIRVWERRYNAVEPRRSDTNRRLYSDADVERLRLLRKATLSGRRIGDVAEYSDDELRQLTADDAEAEALAPRPAGKRNDVSVQSHHDACLAAVRALDGDGLQQALSNAAVTLATPVLLERLLMPLLREIGDLWREGTLRVAHEHLASAIVRSFLGALKNRGNAGVAAESGPEVVVTTPAGQIHELGALMVAVTASLDGWRVTYLGPNLPAEEIAAAVRGRDCKALAMSVVYPADDPQLVVELRRLRDLLPEGLPVIVGGSAAHGYGQVLAEVGATVREDMQAFRRELESIRFGR